MLVQILFFLFSTILVLAALAVITSRNPVYSALALVMCFVTSAAIWLLIEAEFLAVVLVLVYVGAVMVLFLFVVMMLDIDLAELRQGFTRFAWLGWVTALAVIIEIAGRDLGQGGLGIDTSRAATARPADYSNTLRARTRPVHPVRLSAGAGGDAAAGGDRGRHRAHHAPARGTEEAGRGCPGGGAGPERLRIVKMDAEKRP